MHNHYYFNDDVRGSCCVCSISASKLIIASIFTVFNHTLIPSYTLQPFGIWFEQAHTELYSVLVNSFLTTCDLFQVMWNMKETVEGSFCNVWQFSSFWFFVSSSTHTFNFSFLFIQFLFLFNCALLWMQCLTWMGKERRCEIYMYLNKTDNNCISAHKIHF